MSNALNVFPGQSNIMTALFLEVSTCDVFDLMLWWHSSTPLHVWVLKASICQHLNVPLISHPISCFRILKNKRFSQKIVEPSRFNVWCRGALASVHGQQLHILEASVKLLLVIHLHTLCEAIQKKTWDDNSVIFDSTPEEILHQSNPSWSLMYEVQIKLTSKDHLF